jgi:hypothetical protein
MSFYVADKFRENPLSLTEGGKDVEIFYDDRVSMIYSRIKNPFAFWKKAQKGDSTILGYKVLGESKN